MRVDGAPDQIASRSIRTFDVPHRFAQRLAEPFDLGFPRRLAIRSVFFPATHFTPPCQQEAARYGLPPAREPRRCSVLAVAHLTEEIESRPNESHEILDSFLRVVEILPILRTVLMLNLPNVKTDDLIDIPSPKEHIHSEEDIEPIQNLRTHLVTEHLRNNCAVCHVLIILEFLF